MTDNLQAEFLVSYAIQWLIERAKASRYMPWITAETGNLNKLITAVLAAAYAAGVTLTVSHPGAGHWMLDFTGLTATNLYHFLGHGIRVYALSKGWYKFLGQPVAPAPSPAP